MKENNTQNELICPNVLIDLKNSAQHRFGLALAIATTGSIITLFHVLFR